MDACPEWDSWNCEEIRVSLAVGLALTVDQPPLAVGVRFPLCPPCDVSGHRGHLSQDIVDGCGRAARLVVAARIEGQLAKQLTVLADDPHVCIGNEQPDALALVCSTDVDVMQPA